MKLCRFTDKLGAVRIGLVENETILDLAPAGVADLRLLENDEPEAELRRLSKANLPKIALTDARLLCPIEQHEVWAAGVTYLRSKNARMDESEFSATAYDRVYDAHRPELFFKALPQKVAGPFESVGIRRDSRWNVPEPELALVLNSRGKVVAYTIGNDMSSRDIEGENLLYLPQAKIYERSCALGPWLQLGVTEAEARQWAIQLAIRRRDEMIFQGETSVAQIKRGFEELARFLFRSQNFPHGAVLLTGTGIVPPDTFTLEEGDHIEITVSGIGMLTNRVVRV